MALAPAAAEAVQRAAAATVGEEAAPRRHAGAATARGRARSEVRDGSLPGTCDSPCFQMARRVSPPLLHRRVGFASSLLRTNLMRMLHICVSGAGCSFPVS